MASPEVIVSPCQQSDLEDLETDLFLEGAYRHYGYDFRQYARGSLRRRIRLCLEREQLKTVSALQERVLYDPGCMERFLRGVAVHTTEMFRDSVFFRVFRDQVVPWLRLHPLVRLWHAGCSTGEEVYSLAILLHEEGLYDRCRIYATDLSETALSQAKEGIYPLTAMRGYSESYLRAGGQGSLSEYFTASYGNAILHAPLRRNVVFARHNLATDGSFHEFHAIVCRNVLIYFNQTLQERACKLFADSLCPSGVLALGLREVLRPSPAAGVFDPLDKTARIYRKVR